jgi:deazaflavin-dependent oxidoreductase (nitroreductase family)
VGCTPAGSASVWGYTDWACGQQLNSSYGGSSSCTCAYALIGVSPGLWVSTKLRHYPCEWAPRAGNPYTGCVGLADAIQGPVLRLHGQLYERSDGRVGHRMIGVPTLLLRSTGRRTGALRCNALVYAADGSDYVLVASNGGSDHPPGWLFNVRAQPAVEVQVARRRSPGTARVLEPGDADYERLWRLVNDHNHGRYDAYQRGTARPIPLVVVTPA